MPAPEAADAELQSALRRVLEVAVKEHRLSGNQLLVLAAELHRVGTHRLVEEHLARFRRRQRAAEAEG